MLPPMFDCVLLAAGASSRMRSPSMRGEDEGRGALKPLLPFGGSTLVEVAVGSAMGAGARVVLVLGHGAEEVAAPFDAEAYRGPRAGGRLALVLNSRWEEGMVGSIVAALPSIRGEAFFIAHADMPFVAPGHYRALAAAWLGSAAAGEAPAAAIASCGGREGHPVLLPSAWIPEILGLAAGDRFKPFLEGRPRVLVETGPGALRDIDTPGDYLAACQSPEAM
jgi:molybdenum cofactor cytidylyltransferase